MTARQPSRKTPRFDPTWTASDITVASSSAHSIEGLKVELRDGLRLVLVGDDNLPELREHRHQAFRYLRSTTKGLLI